MVKKMLRWSLFCAATKRPMQRMPDWEPYYAVQRQDLGTVLDLPVVNGDDAMDALVVLGVKRGGVLRLGSDEHLETVLIVHYQMHQIQQHRRWLVGKEDKEPAGLAGWGVPRCLRHRRRLYCAGPNASRKLSHRYL